jgi:hypothetical protein
MMSQLKEKLDVVVDAYFEYFYNESMSPYDEMEWLISNLKPEAQEVLLEWYNENH